MTTAWPSVYREDGAGVVYAGAPAVLDVELQYPDGMVSGGWADEDLTGRVFVQRIIGVGAQIVAQTLGVSSTATDGSHFVRFILTPAQTDALLPKAKPSLRFDWIVYEITDIGPVAVTKLQPFTVQQAGATAPLPPAGTGIAASTLFVFQRQTGSPDRIVISQIGAGRPGLKGDKGDPGAPADTSQLVTAVAQAQDYRDQTAAIAETFEGDYGVGVKTDLDEIKTELDLVLALIQAGGGGGGGGGDAFTLDPPTLTLESNTLPGNPIADVTSTIVSRTRTVIDPQSFVAIDGAGNLMTGPAAIDYTSLAGSGYQYSFKINDTNAAGEILQKPFTLTVIPLDVDLNALSLSNATTVGNLGAGFVIGTVAGRYSDGIHAPGKLKLVNPDGSPYTAGKLSISNATSKVKTAGVAIAPAEVHQAALLEDFGGSTRITPISVTGTANAAPSGGSVTPSSPVIMEWMQELVWDEVARVSATPGGVNDDLQWSLPASGGGQFEIDTATGSIMVGRLLDRSEGASYALTARATDRAGQFVDVAVPVTVQTWTPPAVDPVSGAVLVGAIEPWRAGALTVDGGGKVLSMVGREPTPVTYSHASKGPQAVTRYGKTVLQFNGNNVLRATAGSIVSPFYNAALPLRPDPFTMILVVEPTYQGAAILNWLGWKNGGSNTSALQYIKQTENNARLTLNGGYAVGGQPTIGQQQVIAIVYDPSGQFPQIIEYKDGVRIVGNNIGLSQQASTGFQLGYHLGNDPTAGDGFQGYLTSMHLYKGLLSRTVLESWVRWAKRDAGGNQNPTLREITDLRTGMDIHREDFNDPGFDWWDPANGNGGRWTPGPSPAQRVRTGGAQASNPEQAWYPWPPAPDIAALCEPFRVERSKMVLRAERTPPTMYPLIGANGGATTIFGNANPFLPGTSYPWIGAICTTADTTWIQYGAIFYRFCIDLEIGLWPGIWAYAVANAPLEFDLLEVFGQLRDAILGFYATVHATDGIGFSGGSQGRPEGPVVGYDYSMRTGKPIELGLIKLPNKIQFLCNRRVFWELTATPSMQARVCALLDLTVAKASAYTTPPDGSWDSTEMEVDSVVFRKFFVAAPAIISGTQAETTAFRNVAPLTTAEGNALNDLIRQAKAYNMLGGRRGTFSMLQSAQGGNCFAFADPAAHLVSLFQPTGPQLVQGGTLTPVVGGYRGNGVDGAFDTGHDFVAETGTNKIGPRDVRIGAWVLSMPTADALTWVAGADHHGIGFLPSTQQMHTLTGNVNRAVTAYQADDPVPALQLGYNTFSRTNSVALFASQPYDDIATFANGRPCGPGTRSNGVGFAINKPFRIFSRVGGSSTIYTDAALAFVDWGVAHTEEEAYCWAYLVNEFLHGVNPTAFPMICSWPAWVGKQTL